MAFYCFYSSYSIQIMRWHLQQSSIILMIIPNRHCLVQNKQWKYQNNVWNPFKVNNKNTRTTAVTSFWCCYCQLWTDFTHCSGVSIVDFEQINAGWVVVKRLLMSQVVIVGEAAWIFVQIISFTCFSHYWSCLLQNFNRFEFIWFICLNECTAQNSIPQRIK